MPFSDVKESEIFSLSITGCSLVYVFAAHRHYFSQQKWKCKYRQNLQAILSFQNRCMQTEYKVKIRPKIYLLEINCHVCRLHVHALLMLNTLIYRLIAEINGYETSSANVSIDRT